MELFAHLEHLAAEAAEAFMLYESCIQSSEMGSEIHFIPALKSGFRYETIRFQVIHLLREVDGRNTRVLWLG